MTGVPKITKNQIAQPSNKTGVTEHKESFLQILVWWLNEDQLGRDLKDVYTYRSFGGLG